MNRQEAALLDTREGQLAVRARLYRLLADREDLMWATASDIADRIERTSPPYRMVPLPLVEALAVEDVTEVDRVCGVAVRLLRKGSNSGVIDLLGYLEPDRLAAVALALPEERRRTILGKDVNWAIAFDLINMDGVREVEAELRDDELAQREVDECFRALGIDGERITRELRKYQQGLPNDLTAEEVAPLSEEERAEARELLAELDE